MTTEYKLTFRYCDIVPAFHRRKNDVDSFRSESNAINEVLLLPSEMGITWTIVSREDDEEEDRCIITATVEGEHDAYKVKQKYQEYLKLRAMTVEEA